MIPAIAEDGVAGIRGTKVVSVVKPEGTIFYVLPGQRQIKAEKGKIKVRLYSPECLPDSLARQFIAERLSKNMPLRQILDEALEAQLDPCDVIRAAIMLGVEVKELVPTFQQVCLADPEYRQICSPCILLKCTVEALRCLKVVEVTEGQYAIIMKDLAPILGEIEPGDLETIANLILTGPEGLIPYYPPTPEQLDQARLTQETLQVYHDLIRAGADEGALLACLGAMGVTYVPLEAPPPPPVLGGGGGGPVTPITPPVPPASPSQ